MAGISCEKHMVVASWNTRVNHVVAPINPYKNHPKRKIFQPRFHDWDPQTLGNARNKQESVPIQLRLCPFSCALPTPCIASGCWMAGHKAKAHVMLWAACKVNKDIDTIGMDLSRYFFVRQTACLAPTRDVAFKKLRSVIL
eukprot:5478460-Amphidinium_carterae.1